MRAVLCGVIVVNAVNVVNGISAASGVVGVPFAAFAADGTWLSLEARSSRRRRSGSN